MTAIRIGFGVSTTKLHTRAIGKQFSPEDPVDMHAVFEWIFFVIQFELTQSDPTVSFRQMLIRSKSVF